MVLGFSDGLLAQGVRNAVLLQISAQETELGNLIFPQLAQASDEAAHGADESC